MVLPWNWLNVLILSIFFSVSVFSAEPAKVVFQKQNIQIGAKKINVEIAKTTVQHERGLMFRNSLPKDSGMLFIFNEEQVLRFWMKNTFIDLSIAYIDKNKKIIDILDMKATSTVQTDFPSYSSSKPATYALEMNLGWFKKNNVRVGDLLSLTLSK